MSMILCITTPPNSLLPLFPNMRPKLFPNIMSNETLDKLFTGLGLFPTRGFSASFPFNKRYLLSISKTFFLLFFPLFFSIFPSDNLLPTPKPLPTLPASSLSTAPSLLAIVPSPLATVPSLLSNDNLSPLVSKSSLS